MLKLKRRMPDTVLSKLNEEHNHLETMPLPAVPTATISFGADFNLIRMVEEYGPKRLTEIAKERAALEDRLKLLSEEARQITNLVDSLTA